MKELSYRNCPGTLPKMAGRFCGAISRRDALKLMMGSGPGLVLAACSSSPTPVLPPQTNAKAEGGQLPAEQPAAPLGITGETLALPVYEMGELEVLVRRHVPEEVAAKERFNAWFEETYPGVVVSQQYLQAGLDYLDRLDTLLAAGIAPDVFELWEWHVQSSALKGMVVNLDPFFEGDGQVGKDDLVPAALEGGSWQGGVYTFVVDFMPGPASLYYNASHFDMAGLDHPGSGWTWDDMRTAALALTVNGGGGHEAERWSLTFGTSFVQWLYWIWSSRGDFLNEEETACVLTGPEATATIQYWADLINLDRVAVSPVQFQEPLDAVLSGAASMCLGNYWDVARLEAAREEGLNWGAVLAPRANSGGRTWYGHFRGWAVSQQADVPTTAWLYVRDFILNHTLGPSRIPSLKRLLPAFDNERNRELGYGSLVELALEPGLCRVPGYGLKWEQISRLVQAELDHVFAGAARATDALAVACSRVDDELMDNCAHPQCS